MEELILIIEGKHTCKHCGKEFDWYYIVPQELGSSSIRAERIPKDKAGLCNVIRSEKRNSYKYPLEATVHCTRCDSLNNLEIKYEE